MKNGKKAKSWFVIIIGDNERRGPFEVTQRAFILSIVCLMVVFTVIAAGSSWLCSRPYITSNKGLADELADARQSIELISREKESFSEEIKKLKTEIATPPEKRNDIVPGEGKGEITLATAKNDTAVEPKPFVSVEEIQIAYDEGEEKLKVRCTIKSQRIDERYVSGYVFIVLNPAPDSPALCKTSPVVELAGGFPRSYEKGEKFSIARFKYIEGVFPSISDRKKYTSVSVLVYADDGTLRLKKKLSL
ncbi:MAG: hypothetical protein E4H15_01500 [Syntrophobacterales bacterium]|nr:MAG: hypothetical protein E4H15_01500 [Syntrophobacterales bacterium]